MEWNDICKLQVGGRIRYQREDRERESWGEIERITPAGGILVRMELRPPKHGVSGGYSSHKSWIHYKKILEWEASVGVQPFETIHVSDIGD